MQQPGFRFVCVPEALQGASGEWAREMLGDGAVALLASGGGLDAISAAARALGLVSVTVVLGDHGSDAQEDAVMAHAEGLPLVWVAPSFSERATSWARERGPMTLLASATGSLAADERRRIGRFVATLGRQSE